MAPLDTSRSTLAHSGSARVLPLVCFVQRVVSDHLTLTPDTNTRDNDKGLLMSSMENPEVKEPWGWSIR